MLHKPFYDPEKTYEENLEKGPFGDFDNSEIYEQKGEPLFVFFNQKVYAPFGIPAGPLINGKFCQAALDKGFDIVVYKTVRTKKYPCHKWPNVLSVKVDGDLTLDKANNKLKADHDYEEPLSITNSFGVPSDDPSFWQKDIEALVKNVRQGQIVVGGFQGTKVEGGDTESYINDFCLAAKMLKDVGIKVMEVNFSCPNEGTANLLCFDVEKSTMIASRIKETIGDIPLIVKIAYFEDQTLLKKFVENVGKIVDGISAINTIAGEIVDDKGGQALPGSGRERSGVCGQSIKWAGIEMTRRLKDLRMEFGYKYTIVGVGGVFNVNDFTEYREAGADVVMSATGAMWNPNLAKEIKKIL